MSFMIETSARHIHLTQESVEKLFGEGYQLTVRKPLSYPGQYASNERLTIVGPKKEMANVSILGPTRKADQVEISATDARTLGIDAPIRESGDVKGSGACKLIGPKGELDLTEGVIIAKRHLHVTEEDAAEMGIKNGEIILFEAAARELKRLGAVPLPTTESMKTELANLNAEKERLLAEYKAARAEAQEYETVKQNVDALLTVAKEQEQQRRHELE